MQRYKLTIEYDGTGYCGWQYQPDRPSISQAITNAIKHATGQQIILFSCGRTDAGVHAIAQVAHFDLPPAIAVRFPPYNMVCSLNYHLKDQGISIIAATHVDKSFHARFSAKKRHYKYYIINRHGKLALLNKRAWHIKKPLDVEAMRDGAKLLCGTHDFSSFRKTTCQANSPIRTLEKMDITLLDNNLIEFDVCAISFLHHQVRNMVGTLSLVGKKVIPPQEITKLLALHDRNFAGPTAPACGLYFWHVDY